MDSRAPSGPPGHSPSGLFPSGPPRPTFREPHPVRAAGVLGGSGAAAAWLLLFGLLATSARGYVWLTLFASGAAAGAAFVLARVGDRGVAVGVAITTGLGLGIAVAVAFQRWMTTGWPLW
jgi:hypothetical protein